MDKFRIGLFIPCYIDTFHPQVGAATLQLLEKAECIELINLDRKDGAEYITSYDMSCLMHLEGIIRRQDKPIKVIRVAEFLKSGLRRIA
jgi:Fe-S oxidoreductase